jgi:hypothetical protein
VLDLMAPLAKAQGVLVLAPTLHILRCGLVGGKQDLRADELWRGECPRFGSDLFLFRSFILSLTTHARLRTLSAYTE